MFDDLVIDEKSAADVMNMLDRSDQRSRKLNYFKRSAPRRSYRVAIRALAYAADSEFTQELIEKESASGWSRDISESGMSCLFPVNFRGEHLAVAIDADRTIWMKAKVVRKRKVHSDFHEYGIQFLGRISAGRVEHKPETRVIDCLPSGNKVLSSQAEFSKWQPELGHEVSTVLEPADVDFQLLCADCITCCPDDVDQICVLDSCDGCPARDVALWTHDAVVATGVTSVSYFKKPESN